MSKRTIIYARVSSKRQSTDRQIKDLSAFADSKGYLITQIITEKVSSYKVPIRKRPELLELLDCINNKDCDMVLVTELSRLGRSGKDIDTIVNALRDNKVNLYIQNQGISLLDNKGKVNTHAMLLISMIKEISQIESETLSERIKSGQRAAREKGVKIGRPTGQTPKEEYLRKHKAIVKEIRNGMSIVKTSKICGVSENTVKRVRKRMFA